MISGDVLKYLKGLRFVMGGRYPAPYPTSSRVCLTSPQRLIRAGLLQILFSIRSERQLVARAGWCAG
jgi:transposase